MTEHDKSRRLLILDDEPAVAQTVAFAAKRHGFAVRMSESPEAFFDDVAGFEPSHIIIDLLMPGMDGVEVLRNLAAGGCGASIIMMSGMGSKVLESAQRVGIERGLRIIGTLPKPFCRNHSNPRNCVPCWMRMRNTGRIPNRSRPQIMKNCWATSSPRCATTSSSCTTSRR